VKNLIKAIVLGASHPEFISTHVLIGSDRDISGDNHVSLSITTSLSHYAKGTLLFSYVAMTQKFPTACRVTNSSYFIVSTLRH